MKNNKLVKHRLIIFDGDLTAAVNCANMAGIVKLIQWFI